MASMHLKEPVCPGLRHKIRIPIDLGLTPAMIDLVGRGLGVGRLLGLLPTETRLLYCTLLLCVLPYPFQDTVSKIQMDIKVTV